MKSMREEYNMVAEVYARYFCKHIFGDADIYDKEMWTGGDIGSVLYVDVGDMWVDYRTIIEVVDGVIAPDTFLEWYDYYIDGGTINLKHWNMGLRDSKKL
jgi:hypothetical protein